MEGEQNEFDELKRIVKELLFNGADRNLKGRFILSQLNTRLSSDIQEYTPLELLYTFREQLPEDQFALLASCLVSIRFIFIFKGRIK